jgi:hypothetical protein
MSKFSPEQRRKIICEARANARRRDDVAATRAGAPSLVYKRRDNARVADAAPVAAAVAVQHDTSTWAGWVEQRLEERAAITNDAVGEVIGTVAAELRAEVKALRRELKVLRREVGVERSLRDARSDLARLHRAIPQQLPVIEARLAAEQVSLRHELDATKERLSKVRTNQSTMDFKLSKLAREQAAAPKVELEFETSTSRFSMKNMHPEAAQTLRRFASEVIDAKDGGGVWVSRPAGHA